MSGEFDVTDPDFAAEMIQAATLKFSYPQLFTRLPLEKLERELEGVYQLVVAGLKAGFACVDPEKTAVEAGVVPDFSTTSGFLFRCRISSWTT